MQTLIGQVYNVEGIDYKKKVNGVNEDRRMVKFRLGMQKPYKEQVNGEEKRLSVFVTAKCFNGLSETIEKYFGGDENKGRWIQLQGHYEENKYNKEFEIEDPEAPGRVLVDTFPTTSLEFIITSFNFIGDAPDQTAKPKNTTPTAGPKVRVKQTAGAPVSAKDAQEEIKDDDAPF